MDYGAHGSDAVYDRMIPLIAPTSAAASSTSSVVPESNPVSERIFLDVFPSSPIRTI